MAIERAYTVLTERSFREDDKFVYIEGIATTPKADRMDDVVEPLGAIFKTPMPLLWQHNHNAPVGHMTFAKATAAGIPFKAQIPKVSEPGNLKNRIDEAIQSLQYGLVSAVSIGFQPVAGEMERLKTGGTRFLKWVWLELSLVTIPANDQALLSTIKSLDRKHAPPASGQRALDAVVKLVTPGVSGSQTATSRGAVKLLSKGQAS